MAAPGVEAFGVAAGLGTLEATTGVAALGVAEADAALDTTAGVAAFDRIGGEGGFEAPVELELEVSGVALSMTT